MLMLLSALILSFGMRLTSLAILYLVCGTLLTRCRERGFAQKQRIRGRQNACGIPKNRASVVLHTHLSTNKYITFILHCNTLINSLWTCFYLWFYLPIKVWHLLLAAISQFITSETDNFMAPERQSWELVSQNWIQSVKAQSQVLFSLVPWPIHCAHLHTFLSGALNLFQLQLMSEPKARWKNFCFGRFPKNSP
jgi:hypothetical protein